MSGLLIQLAIAAGIFLAGVAAGIKIHAGQDAIAAQEMARAEAKDRHVKAEKINTAAVKLEKAKETVRTEFVEIERVVDHVVEAPVYLERCMDDNGLRQLNVAIGTRANSGVAAPAVPASGPAR